MKKVDALIKIDDWLKNTKEKTAEGLLKFLQTDVGMDAPVVEGELKRHLYDIYVEPNLNQWDEDVEKDPKVQKRREEAVLRDLNKKWRPS